MDQGRLARWSPLTGIVFAILFVVGGAFYDGTPSIDASDEAIVAYYTDSDNQLKLQIVTLGLTLAAVLFVWFVGVLAGRLRAAEGQDSSSDFSASQASLAFRWACSSCGCRWSPCTSRIARQPRLRNGQRSGRAPMFPSRGHARRDTGAHDERL